MAAKTTNPPEPSQETLHHEMLLERLNRSLRTLSDSNEAVLRAESREELLSHVLRALMQGETYSDVWYGTYADGLLLPQRTGDWRPNTMLPEQQYSMALVALDTGKPQVKRRSVESHMAQKPGLVAIPVQVDDDESGVLVLTTPDPAGFDDEELTLVERVVSNIAFGLRSLSRRAELDRLFNALQDSEERERRSLASKLHDGVIQNLAAVKNRLTLLREHHCSDKDAANELQETLALLSDTIQDTRSLTLQLSPPILYHLGLEAAIEWLADWIGEQFGMQVTVHGCGFCDALPERVSVPLFRSTRELMINATKHANTHQAEVSITCGAGRVRVTVSDKGCGFDTALATEFGKSGFGLFSLRERFKRLGGSFHIESRIGEGTTATLELPLGEPSMD